MNKIDYLVPFHYGILNWKKIGRLDTYDLDNFKHISVIFSLIDGYNRNRFKMAEFYLENKNEIDKRLNQIKEDYSIYLSTFRRELVYENFYGEGEHLYTSPTEFYNYLKQQLEP